MTQLSLSKNKRALAKAQSKKEPHRATLDGGVRSRQQQELIKHFGTFYFDPDYDYKKEQRVDRVDFQSSYPASPNTSAVKASIRAPALQASGGNPAFKHVCSRNLILSHPCSIATCGSSRPR